MPLIRKSASDVTTYRRVSATNLPVPTIKSSVYTAPLRNIIPPIARASAVGLGASPGNTVLQVYGGVVPPAPPPPPGEPITGSLYFDAQYVGTSLTPVGAWISVSNPAGDLSPGTADFTIEWWQYLSTNPYKTTPTVFNLGTAVLGFYLDVAGPNRFATLVLNGLPLTTGFSFVADNAWVHFAIVRSGNQIVIYYNGSDIFATGILESTSFDSSDPLLIGTALTSPDNDQVFEGNITNFRWVIGTAVYTTLSFTPPENDLPVIPGTKLLLLAKDSGSALTNTAGGPFVLTNSAVEWSSAVPS